MTRMITSKLFFSYILSKIHVNCKVSGKNIIIDSKSGYSGAGRGVHKKYENKNLYESLSAYGIGFHRHNSEIEQEIYKVTNKII